MSRTALAFAAAVAMLAAATRDAPAGMSLSMDDRPTLADCDQRVREAPDELESALCYWIVSRRGFADEARARLERRLAENPADHGARLYLGMVEADAYGSGAERLLSDAADGFAADRDDEGEFYARLGLQGWQAFRGRTREADREIARLREIAQRTGDPEHLAAAALAAAWARLDAGAYTDAEVYLEAADRYLYPEGPSWLRLRFLHALSRVAWSRGRLREVVEYQGRAAELAESRGNLYFAALLRAQQAEALTALAQYGEESAEAARDSVDAAITMAVRAGNPAAESIGRLLRSGDPRVPPAERDLEATTAAELASRVGDVVDSAAAEVALAERALARGGAQAEAEAFERYDRAAAIARAGGRRDALASARLGRAMVGVNRRPAEEVLRDHLEAIEAIERMRDLQWDHVARARMLWSWSQAYHSMAAVLIARGEPGDVDRAFETVERMRVRVASEIFDPAHDPIPPEASRELLAWRASLEEVGDLRRRIQSPGTPPSERSALVEQIDDAEVRELHARRVLATADPEYDDLTGTRPASLAAIRAALDPDEAMIVYQVPTRGALRPLPAWAFVVTRDAGRVAELPRAAGLGDAVALALGAWRRRDRVSDGPARTLYEAVAAPVQAALPPGVRRWIVIPDGALHEVPFGALVDPATGRTLAETHALSVIPSATLWLRLRSMPAPVPRRGALLALADPELDEVTRERLPPLTGARAEAESARRVLGGGTVAYGADAVSDVLRRSAPDAPAVVLIAAHALVDSADPERSAIALADGPLTLREIRDLPLDGAVVILSGCASATGETTSGEGVLGLSRAFFRAGARTVVATLWPVRDDEAARAVSAIARGLGRGRSVDDALHDAQRAFLIAGAPAVEWAAWNALGDTRLVPIAAPTVREEGVSWWPWILASIAAAAVAAWTARPRRMRLPV